MVSTNMSNETILAHANNLVVEWSNQFENPPKELPVSFTVNDAGMLCANGIVLFPAKETDLSSLSFEVDTLYLSPCNGEDYIIGLNWRISGPPYLLFVKKVATLFTAP